MARAIKISAGYFVFLALILAAAALMDSYFPTRPLSEAERNKYDKEQEQRDYLCHLKSVCPKYGKIRQECATAGSYRTCISIKMGSDSSLTSGCTEEGEILVPDNVVPGFLECLLRR